MNTNETTKPQQVGGSVLNDLLGMIDNIKSQQELLWENIKDCAKNNKIPDEIPNDAVLILSSDIFENLSVLFKQEYSGRVFKNNLLPNDKIIIMKMPKGASCPPFLLPRSSDPHNLYTLTTLLTTTHLRSGLFKERIL